MSLTLSLPKLEQKQSRSRSRRSRSRWSLALLAGHLGSALLNPLPLGPGGAERLAALLLDLFVEVGICFLAVDDKNRLARIQNFRRLHRFLSSLKIIADDPDDPAAL